MTPRDLRNIHTIRNSCREALLCPKMALKLPVIFNLLMEMPVGCCFHVWSAYYHTVQCNPKTAILISSR